MRPDYEFNFEENELVLELGTKTRIMSVAFFVFALLSMVLYLVESGPEQMVFLGLSAMFLMFTFFHWRSAGYFWSIANTKEDDIKNLLGALTNLSRSYILMFVSSLVIIAITILLTLRNNIF